MKLRYRRSGGFANITTKVELDSSKLPPRKASEIRSIVEEARLFDQPAQLRRKPDVADDFEHELEIIDRNRSHKIRRSDSQCTPELIRLFDRLQQEAHKKR